MNDTRNENKRRRGRTAPPSRPASVTPRRSAGRANALRPWTLWAPPLRVVDLLPFVELVVSRALHSGHVEEQVFLSARPNEPETLVGQPLDRPLRHLSSVLSILPTGRHLTPRRFGE